MRVAPAIFLGALLCPVPAAAQTAADSAAVGRNPDAFAWGVWAAGSPGASGGWPHFGTTEGRRFGALGVRASFTFARSDGVAVRYNADAIPLAVVSGSHRELTGSRPGTAQGSRSVEVAPAYGFGFSPVGLEVELFRQWPVRPTLGASAGVLWFGKPVPEPESRSFNFAAEFTGGVEVSTAVGVLAVGARLHHFSNAGTADLNPGQDTRLLYVGLRR